MAELKGIEMVGMGEQDPTEVTVLCCMVRAQGGWVVVSGFRVWLYHAVAW